MKMCWQYFVACQHLVVEFMDDVLQKFLMIFLKYQKEMLLRYLFLWWILINLKP